MSREREKEIRNVCKNKGKKNDKMLLLSCMHGGLRSDND